MTPEKKIFQPLTSKGVCQIYELLLETELVSFSLNPEVESKVDAIVSSINATYYGVDRYPTAEERSVAYLYFIIKGHPFTDGNKRAAVLTFKVVCERNNIIPIHDVPLDALAIYIENKKPKDHHSFIKLLAMVLFDKKE